MNAFEHIDAYMSGQLKGTDLEVFERTLERDKELKSLVDNYYKIKGISSGILEMELLSEVKSVSNNYENADIKKNNTWIKWPWFLVFLLGLAGLLYFFMKQEKVKDTISPEQMYAEVYQEPIWPVRRSGQSDRLSKAMSLYLNGDIASAKTFLLDSLEDRSIGHYWLSEVYMKENKMDSVLKYTQTVPSKEVLAAKSRYLRVLALLIQGDVNTAREEAALLDNHYKQKIAPYLSN